MNPDENENTAETPPEAPAEETPAEAPPAEEGEQKVFALGEGSECETVTPAPSEPVGES